VGLAWQHHFQGFAEAKREIYRWIGWYNEGRPHQALGYLSPAQYRRRQEPLVAGVTAACKLAISPE
jgi:putative transposase